MYRRASASIVKFQSTVLFFAQSYLRRHSSLSSAGDAAEGRAQGLGLLMIATGR
jgi:hypothetical protein